MDIRSQFKFLKMWTLNDDCARLIKDTWNALIVGCPMYILDKKLRILKSRLKKWNKFTFGNVHDNVKVAECNLNDIQQQIQSLGYSDNLQVLEAKAQHEFEKALNMEEELWREKARIKWHLQGDRNTNYFHTYAKIKRKTKMIYSLLIDGKIETNHILLEKHIESHFKELFNYDFRGQAFDLIDRVIPKLVNDQTNDMLLRLPSPEEIQAAILNLNIDFAPRPDGLGWILPNFNANTLIMLPKIKENNSIGNYRPIAMANFKYKLILKILADRGDTKSLTPISNLLKGYAQCSGQICNSTKSIIYVGGMSMERHCRLAEIIGFSKASPPFLYLGVPFFIGKPKANNFNFLADNIKIKLATWKANLLSMAGRVILVKTKLVTIAWKKCCLKKSEGSLGIISLKHYNLATNIHLCWLFLNQNQSWAKLLAARVKRGSKLIKYSIKSSLWKGFKEVYDKVVENSIWVIGNGLKTNFWLDNWTGEILAFKYKIPEQFHSNLKNYAANYWTNNSWALHDNIQLAFPGLLSLISYFSVADLAFEDSLI
ncbi:uncharacterized protein LOC131637017 [Vicia villosa]|uniref:uncharacterized protein LOC131637017 n=1 Tax=Vicia villosa TaxID=3911 RepID=UPI00273BB8A8|nr:uncharacterized protein LOC131637017 [Vicia villosa]